MLSATLLCMALLPMFNGVLPQNISSVWAPSPVSFPQNSSISRQIAHSRREHMVEPGKVEMASIDVVKPVHEENFMKDEQKPIVPKKGVSSSDLPNTSSITNGSVVYKKPLVTEADTDYLSQEDSKENEIAVNEIDPSLVNSKIARSKYIIPIVAVILSVPLVAILLSVLYKRGTDWWQHRNYKRMDFLIEGIYQN